MELAEARALVEDKTDKDSTVRHLISVEGVMRALARRFGEDEDRWALAGLFHDLDQDQTGEDSDRHASLAARWLREAGVEEPVINAVLAHAHEQYRTDLMAKAVVHADAIAGCRWRRRWSVPSGLVALLEVAPGTVRLSSTLTAVGACQERSGSGQVGGAAGYLAHVPRGR